MVQTLSVFVHILHMTLRNNIIYRNSSKYVMLDDFTQWNQSKFTISIKISYMGTILIIPWIFIFNIYLHTHIYTQVITCTIVNMYFSTWIWLLESNSFETSICHLRFFGLGIQIRFTNSESKKWDAFACQMSTCQELGIPI